MNIKHYFMSTVEGFSWKATASILGTFVAYIEGFYGSLLWVFLIMFGLDWVTGILKSVNKGVPIESKRLRNSVTKLSAYMVLITALIVASSFETSFEPIVTAVYYYFILTELKSIVENVGELGIAIPGFLKDKVDQKSDEAEKKEPPK